MKTEILQNGNLKIVISESERQELQEAKAENEGFDSDDFMYGLFEHLICNSEYEWMLPEHCGALTSAPMLGIYGKDKPLKEGMDSSYFRITCCDGENVFYSPAIKSWAFMDYAVISPQEQLLQKGYAVFMNGH